MRAKKMLEYNLGEGYRLIYKQKSNGFGWYGDIDFRSYNRDKLIRHKRERRFPGFTSVEYGELRKDIERALGPITSSIAFREDGVKLMVQLDGRY